MTISDAYRKEQEILHKNPNYGVASTYFAPTVLDIIRSVGINTVTDYGAGKMRLEESLNKRGLSEWIYQPYDPAFPEYGPAMQGELVCCIDVLEHVEPEFIDETLKHLRDLTQKIAFVTIHTGPAGKFLSDGRNAHLTQEPSSWWLPKICQYFDVNWLQIHTFMGKGFMMVLSPLKSSSE